MLGAGFDVDFGRRRSVKVEMAMRFRDAIAALRGETTKRHLRLFQQLWPSGEITPDMIESAGYSPICVLAAHFANTVLPHAPAKPLILEIGAGSGYLTHFLLKARPGALAYIIDLPEVLPASQSTLKRLGTFARVQFVAADTATFSIPKFDVAVNTQSMQEMLPETIEQYFGLLRRNAQPGAIFYCCNRVEKWLSTESGNSDSPDAKHDIPVRFADYPWGGEKDVFFEFRKSTAGLRWSRAKSG